MLHRDGVQISKVTTISQLISFLFGFFFSLVMFVFLFYKGQIFVVSCSSPPPCAVPPTPLIQFHVQQNYNTQYPPCVSRKHPDSYQTHLGCLQAVGPLFFILTVQFLVIPVFAFPIPQVWVFLESSNSLTVHRLFLT